VEWGIYALMFIWGYITCKMVYFLNAARSSFHLIKAAQLVSLSLLSKSMEDYYFAKIYRMEKMIESEESDHNVTAFSYRMEEERSHYQKKAIQGLIMLHPQFFKPLLEFDDWDSGMKYLEKNKEIMLAFLAKGDQQ
jgi:hypothetical protein